MQNQETQQDSLADTQQQVCQTYKATTEFFDQLPNCITTLKKQYLLDKASVNTRFVLLCLTTLTTAGLTARITPSFIKVTRNTIFSYLGAGLFIVLYILNIQQLIVNPINFYLLQYQKCLTRTQYIDNDYYRTQKIQLKYIISSIILYNYISIVAIILITSINISIPIYLFLSQKVFPHNILGQLKHLKVFKQDDHNYQQFQNSNYYSQTFQVSNSPIKYKR